MKKYLFLFLFCFLGCHKSEIYYLEIYYLPKGVLTPSVLHCDLLDKDIFKDLKVKKVTQDSTLNKLSLLVNELQPDSQDSNLDARIKVLIRYKNKTDILCLGEFFGTSLNGKRMKDDKELFKLIKKNIYE
jgi:hypothetical protein